MCREVKAFDLEPNGRFQLSNQGHNYYRVAIECATRTQLAQKLGIQVSAGAADKKRKGASVSRKHYIAIATTLNYSQGMFLSEPAFEQFCKNMAYTLKQFNPRFSVDRFMEACEAVRNPIEQRNLTF